MTDDQKTAFVSAAHRIAAAGLVRYSSGNLSMRLDDERVAVTATRSWLGMLASDEIAIYSIRQQRYLNDVAGSVESGMHVGVLTKRADVNVVLHFQSPAATALCCSADPMKHNYMVIPEVPYYIGRPAVVGWHMPGSEELAAAVSEAMVDRDMVLMRHHGLVVCGRDYADVTQKAGFFELACSIILSGGELAHLPEAAVRRLEDARRRGGAV